jgi:myo-inositol-1(or 4)-monophosphatase
MLSNELKQLNAAIKSAGQILLQYFGKQLQLQHKSTSADYCTKADLETENAIIAAIEKIFPDYNIFAEEHGHINKGSDYTFVIDPLDGTNNFVLGVPIFTSSVALMRGKETVYGVINHPISGDMYYALRGKGAFLHDRPIIVNQENREKHATVSYFCNYVTPRERIINFKNKLSKLGVRRDLDLWAPAFCYCGLASGKIEAIINDQIELYDFAAGKLIALEAGAKVTDFFGNAFADDTVNAFVISNGTELHSVFVDNITRVLE